MRSSLANRGALILRDHIVTYLALMTLKGINFLL